MQLPDQCATNEANISETETDESHACGEIHTDTQTHTEDAVTPESGTGNPIPPQIAAETTGGTVDNPAGMTIDINAEVHGDDPLDGNTAPMDGEICREAQEGATNVREAARACGQHRRRGRGKPGGCGAQGQGARGQGIHPQHARDDRNQPANIIGPQMLPNPPVQGQTFPAIWQWNRVYPRGPYAARDIAFTGNERILENLPRNPRALDYFKLYITEELIDHIVTQTNLYAAQFIAREQQTLKPHSRGHEWKLTDRAEMLTLLTILILMGVLHKPRMSMYWATDNTLATPIFSQVMKRDRFLLLIKFLHFVDNTNHNAGDPGHHKLYKVREIIDMIKKRCSDVYSPAKHLSMDESLVLFKGRLSFKQYIKTKRKIWYQVVPALHIKWNSP